MSSAIRPAKYEKLSIIKNNTEVRLEGKTSSFQYYESVLSPFVTVKMSYVDTGNGTISNTDRQGRVGTIYNSLPIEGEEQISFLIQSKLGELNFLQNPLLVNGSSNSGQDSTKETIFLDLISKEGLINFGKTLNKKYSGTIYESVNKILKDEFGIPFNSKNIEKTKRNYTFIGGGRTPLDILIDLASKSSPEQGKPGFFFFQTQDGFNFRSIDSLISQDPKAVYKYTGAIRSTLNGEDNNFKIMQFSVGKNRNLINSLKTGVYVSRHIFFDPRTFKYTEKYFNIENGTITKLGSNISIPSSAKQNVSSNYVRTFQHILDVGFYEQGIGKKYDDDPALQVAEATMRYNLLFEHVITMTVPCNPNLRAGDIIECYFEKITTDSKNQGFFDENQSGKYLILHLCHYFDTKVSITSLTIVRDSYGIYTNKNAD
jgi:hypothetical protein